MMIEDVEDEFAGGYFDSDSVREALVLLSLQENLMFGFAIVTAA